MNTEGKMIYEFDSFELDPTERRLLRDGEPVALPPKAFDTLVVLVENNSHLVEKETLLNRVWADSFVEEGNLKICVHTLRKVLNGKNFIETVPKKGYRFNAPVRLIEKTRDDFTIEKQTVSRITIEAGAIDDEPETGVNAAPRMIARPRPLSKIFLALGLLVALVAASAVGAFYYRKNQTAKTSASLFADVKSVAVLPLKSLSVPPTEQELRVGMADSIVTKLSQVRTVAVRPTSATIRYLDKDYDTAAVGKELNVDSILEGSVQKEGQTLKINLQMVGVADGRVLWADTFTNDLSNVLSGQDSVASRISRLLAVGAELNAENVAQGSPNLTAQELYLKGRYAMATSARKIGNVVQARDFYEQAIRLDANYAAAHAALASSYTIAAALNLLAPREAYPKAEIYARRALELNPNLAEGYLVVAQIETNYNWNWQAGEAAHRRAIELTPNAAGVHGDYAEFLARMGRFEEAEYHGDLAHQLDPTAINVEAVKALGYCYAHRYDEAVAQSRAVIEKDQNAYLAYLYLAVAQDAKGNYADALAAAERASSITGGAPPDGFALGCTYALMRDEAKTNEILTKLEAASRQQYVDPFYFAMIHALRGDKDRAFEYLEKCRAEKSYWITTLKVFPFLDALRSDARFAELLQRANLAE